MSDVVSASGYAQFILSAVVIVAMLCYRREWVKLIGSISLMLVALAFLFSAINFESVLLYGTFPPEVQSKYPPVDVQRAHIAFWNIVVPLFIGGIGVNVFSSWLVKFMDKG